MTSWYRRFIKDFAKIAEPLVRLTKKDQKFKWSNEQDEAFEKLKELVLGAPMLHRPVSGAEYFIHTDASETGLGPMITQKIDGVEKVLAFASRAIHKNEKNYSVTEKECLSVKWACEKFRGYIEGEKFTIITDHSALQWLLTRKNPTGRLGRWVQELQGYDFEVIHRKGTCNVVPDALSRMFEDTEKSEGKSESEILAISIIKETTDEWYKKRYNQIPKHPKRYKDWKIFNGNIYRYRPAADIDGIMTDLDAWKLVVPEEKRAEILFEAHDEPTSGHPGKERTYQKIAQNYFWMGMYEDCAKYVKECLIFQQFKNDQRAKIGFIRTREITRPWQGMCTDLMGELPRSNSGNKYLLIFENMFSRFIICTPIKSKNGKIIRKALVS